MILELLGIIGGGVFLLSQLRTNPSEEPEKEETPITTETVQEAPTLPSVPSERSVNEVMQEMQISRDTRFYGRVRGDLERIHHLQKKLDQIEDLLIHTRSFYWRQNDEYEKRITISAPAGKEGEAREVAYTFDLASDRKNYNMAVELVENERNRIRHQISEELHRISEVSHHAATNKEELQQLRNAVLTALKETNKGGM